MADDTKLNVDDYIGQTINESDLQSLIDGGQITFPQKPVNSPASVSQGSDSPCEGDKDGASSNQQQADNSLADMIASVKENESLIKTLEDMRDDMTAGMRIGPANDSIGKSAAIINGDGDTTIHKSTFDKAEAILDIYFPYISPGHIPQLTPLIGDTRILNNLENCHDITKAAFEGLEFAEAGTTPEEVQASIDRSTDEDIANSQEAFESQLAATSMYLINKLFWNYIWARMWTSIFNMIEKLVCKPVDMIIWTVRFWFWVLLFFKQGKDVWYRFGIMHKLVNKLKMIFLCKIPHAAWKDYTPEPNIQIWYNSGGGGKMQPLVGICSDAGLAYFENCGSSIAPDARPVEEEIVKDELAFDDDKSKTAVADAFEKFETDEKLKEESKPDKCDSYFEFMKSYEDLSDAPAPGVTPDCVEAAKNVLVAAYNDARFNNKSNNE